MSNIEQLVEDHATAPVPEAETVSGWHLALVVVGVSIAIPAFIAGAELGTALGLRDAFWSFLIGGGLVAIIGCLTAVIAVHTRLSTYMLIKFVFGHKGAHLVNLVLAATVFGWFGVNALQFGEAVYAIYTESYGEGSSLQLWIIVGSLLMIATTIFGFKALDKLATLAVPILLLMLLAILGISLARAGADSDALFAGNGEMTLGLGISAMVGADIVAVALLPDLARYVKNSLHGICAVIFSFVVAVPLIHTSAAVPALLTGEIKPMLIISALGLSSYTLFTVVLSTWTTNTSNLYSASLSISAIFPKVASWKSTLIVGVLATLLALSGAADHFVDFLLLLGIAIPPIAGIYIVDYFFIQRGQYRLDLLREINGYSWPALCSWLIGGLVAYLGAYHAMTFTGIPACDGLLVASAVYWGSKRLPRTRTEKNLTCENPE